MAVRIRGRNLTGPLLVACLCLSGCSRDTSPTSPSRQHGAGQAAFQTSPDASSLTAGEADPGCGDVAEVRVRFGAPGYVKHDSVGLFVLFHGMPPGRKVIRIWWDLSGSPTQHRDTHIGEGEVQREEDRLFHYEGVVEHRYDIERPTTFKVRAEVVIDGMPHCARNRDVMVTPSTNGPASGGARREPLVDQEQPVIDVSSGRIWAIGGNSQQSLAQVVTTGVTGLLIEVRFPVSCLEDLDVTIKNVIGERPGSSTLTAETISGATLPSMPPSEATFRSLMLSRPVHFTDGDRFAIVLTSKRCGLMQGPVGNPYPGGDAFVNVLPSPPGVWGRFGVRSDLPFQTVVKPD